MLADARANRAGPPRRQRDDHVARVPGGGSCCYEWCVVTVRPKEARGTPQAHLLLPRRALLSSALAAPFGCARQSCPTRAPCEWTNASGTLSVRPDLLRAPTSAAELVSLVRAARQDGKRVRMTGSGHSYSDVALSPDYLLLPTGLEKVLALDSKRLGGAAAGSRHLVRVGSGSTIRFLNDRLARRTPSLALANLGGWNAQTIAGVAMTATHGSGLAFPPIAEQIVSLQIVDSEGKMWQLEPSAGITDEARFPGFLEEDPSIPVELRKDDDWFYAALVSMGCFGIVYAVVVKAVDQFWIREQRSIVSYRDLSKPGGYLEAYLKRPRDPAFPEHLEVTVSPYPNGSPQNDHDALLTRRYRLSEPPAPTHENRTRGLLGDGQILASPTLRSLTEDFLTEMLDGADLRGLSRIHRAFMQALVDKDYVDYGHRVFNLGEANRFTVYGIEMAFDLRQTIAATERIFQLAREEYEEGRHHSVPVTLRFVRAAKSHLAMQEGRDTTMIEIGGLVAARGSEELLRNYEKVLMKEFGARPHWGLDLSVFEDFSEVERLYPRAKQWRELYRVFNRHGTFDGPLTDRLGISVGDGD